MHEIVQDYYGRQLQHSDQLKTSACCDISQIPTWLKPLLARIHPEVLARYYPRNGDWTGASMQFTGFLARRDDDADCILLGGAT